MAKILPSLKSWSLLVLLGIFSLHAQAQLTTSGSTPFRQYVSSLIGPGITISGVNIVADTSDVIINFGFADTIGPQLGSFTAVGAAGTSLGLLQGTVMTSGGIRNMGGPATNFLSGQRNRPGDTNLDALPGATGTTDACAITFSMIPLCDTISIRYVFASEEYPEFAPPNFSTFNDLFAFFITGPGFTPNTNIARLPGTAIPVSISTVNAVTNTSFYIDNGNGTTIVYDAYTVVLTAKAVVQPCQLYTIKLVVADDGGGFGDDAFDSAVFLEAGGIACTGNLPPSVVAGNLNNTSNPVAVEDCVDGFFRFENNADTTQPLTILFNKAGTAIEGTDYTAIPNSVTIPAGQSFALLPIDIISDGLAEGSETLQLIFTGLLCGNTTVDTVTLEILDPFRIQAGPDQEVCPGETETIGPAPVPGYTYRWSAIPNVGWAGVQNPATSTAQVRLNNTSTIPLSVNYVLTATNENGCIDTDTIRITFAPKPPASISGNATTCVGTPATIGYSSVPPANAVYFWDYAGGTPVGFGTGPGPHDIVWSTPGVKRVRLWLTANGCASDTAIFNVTVSGIPTASFNGPTTVCAGSPAQFSYSGSAGAAATYNWDFDGGTGGSGQGPFGVVWTTPGTKTVTLQVIENNCVSTVETRTITVFPVPTATFSAPDSLCDGQVAGIAYIGTGGAGASYVWGFGGGQVLSGSGAGPYTVLWPTSGNKTVTLQVAENGCVSTQLVKTVRVKPRPSVTITQVANQCFPGNSFNFTFTGSPVSSVSWNFGPDATPATSIATIPGSVTYQTPGLKKVSLVVTRNGCVSDSSIIFFEVVPKPSADFNLATNGLCQGEELTFQYLGPAIGANQAYAWNFGSGAVPASSSLQNPGPVRYSTGGTKTVTLTVNYRGCTETRSQTVNVTPALTADAGADKRFCDGDGGVQLQATATGGSQPLFYSWWCNNPGNCGLSAVNVEDPSVNPGVAPFAPDTTVYYFQTTDVNGCQSNIDSLRVIVDAKPLAAAGGDRFICGAGPGQFLNGGLDPGNRAPGPFSYQWSPATGLNDATAPNPFARPDTTTIYTLTVVSSNGCSSDVTTLDTSSTATVFVNPLPVANAGADTALCLGSSIQLQGSASGAGPQYTYRWTPATPGTINNPNTATPTVSPTLTTVFSLVVTSNGCVSDADQVLVVVDAIPTLTPGQDESICYGDSVVLNGAASGDPNATYYTYRWTPAAGLSDPTSGKPKASPRITTLYQLTVSSPKGCGSATDFVIVTVKPTPVVTVLTADTAICGGNPVALKAVHTFPTPAGAPVFYSWTPLAGLQGSPSVPNVTAEPDQTTRYVVRVSVGDCYTEDDVLITVGTPLTADIEADTNRICEGDRLTLRATGGRGSSSYLWTPSTGLSSATVANPTASPSTTTNYTVTITEGLCADTAQFNLVVTPGPSADFFASQQEGCSPMTVYFVENADNTTAYRWQFGDGSPLSNEAQPVHTYEQPGVYPVTLTATGTGGCEVTSAPMNIVVGDPAGADFASTPIAGVRLPVESAAVIFRDLSQNARAWFWTFGDGGVSSEANPTHVYTQPGSYTVTLTVTDANGCVSSVSYGTYEVVIPGLLIPNVITPNNDNVNDVFQVQYEGKLPVTIQVLDRWGRTVFTGDAITDVWNGNEAESGKALPAGVYFYHILVGDKDYTGNITLVK